MAFPLVMRDSQITLEDVERLALPLAELAKARTGCDDFRWVGADDEAALALLPETWQEAVSGVMASGEPQAGAEAGGVRLFLPIGAGRPVAVAILAGCAARRWSPEVLREETNALAVHLAAFRGYYADPLTGMANSLLFQRQLRDLLARGPGRGVLVLLELYPPSRDAERAWAYVQKGGSYLTSLFGAVASLFHFGSGIFALLWEDRPLAEAQQMATMLLNRLRREGFAKAHIGMRQLAQATEAELLDEAWQALAVARKRGPFGLAVHEEAGAASVFPPLTRNEQRKAAAWWRGKEHFALVLVRQDQEAASNHFTKRLRGVLDGKEPYLLLNQREALVFLDGAGSEQAAKWARRFRKAMAQSAGATFSMGIALYPCHSFTKAQMPVNCRKALQHAAFFGPGSQAVFDAVSCNISGDVFYNGGDLPKAVREYRLGLALDPANVNLLNSLGVAYTQLMRPRMAQQCFEAALRLEAGNFMALFNLGFLHLHRGESAKALDSFERALASNDHHFDLLLQLGRLYCRKKRYAEAVKLLRRCVTGAKVEERRNGDRAAAWRMLGEAHAGLGENKKAITAFQKALSFTHRDAQALSMLGELYAREKEGDEIALSLCQEAVTLDGGQGEHWRRLAWVQWNRGDADDAIASLKHCLQLDRKNSAALFWLARIYREQGRLKEAHRLYEKVLRLQPNHAEAKSALAQVRQ
ncbi:MAG: tetratricopeptide repeat protein [Thermodesulfobacteriota bacterium]